MSWIHILIGIEVRGGFKKYAVLTFFCLLNMSDIVLKIVHCNRFVRYETSLICFVGGKKMHAMRKD